VILFKSNSERNRAVALAYIEEKKRLNPNFVVVDLGGSANPWCDQWVDYYVDVVGDGEKLIRGDLQSPDTWERIRAVKPDFCICTHTLEDIRDPGWVIVRISETFSAGFIVVPNKHQELSRGVESWLYPGWCHHRWIFALGKDDVLRAVAKFPVTVSFTSMFAGFAWVPRSKFFSKVARKLRLLPFSGRLKWINRRLAGDGCELSLLFEGVLEFRYLNNDFAGHNMDELVLLYMTSLAEGL